MENKVRIRRPDAVGGLLLDLNKYLQGVLDELKPALDLNVSYIDERANVVDVMILDANEDEQGVDITYEVTYDVYYGCKDQNYSGEDERCIYGHRVDDFWEFDKYVQQENRSTFDEL